MQRPKPRVSVIIPARNERAVIGDLLRDLAPLRDLGHEVILVDGGSSDATVETATPLVDRVVYSVAGRAVQMNAGAGVAEGDVLWFVHADTRVPPEAATAMLAACTAGQPWGRFDVRLSGSRPALRIIATLMNLRSCITGICTGDQGIFVGRTTFEQVGGFAPIALMEDIALSRTLRRLARPVCIHQPPLQASSRRWEEHGILRTVYLMWRLRLAFALGAAPADLARRYP